LLQQGTDALLRERAKHERSYEIQAAQNVLDIKKAERNSTREWKTISVTLQNQVGLEQTRNADIQLQWTRAQSKFNVQVQHLESKLAKEHAACMVIRVQLEVSSPTLPNFLICFFLHGCFLFARPRQHWSTRNNSGRRKQIKKSGSCGKSYNGTMTIQRFVSWI
jgi:hypothetical protein